jgi:phosphoribosylglycinamide formyltransferase-1
MNKIAIFASGSGTNAQNICEYFRSNDNVEISCILSNKEDAYVLQRAKNMNIPTRVFNRQELYETGEVLDFLIKNEINWIVLAGFLWLVPGDIVDKFNNRIVNIHPALLPKFGGKGMYGLNVHRAVIESNERESGISIHYVNKIYDEGNLIFQVRCKVDDTDTPESLAEKVHKLEYKHYPEVIEKLITDSEGT